MPAPVSDTVIELEAEADFAGRQSTGNRPNQEDAYGVVPSADLGDERALLAVVADGMGGHAAGEIASELAVQAFVDGFFDSGSADDGSRLWAGLESANRRIREAIEGDRNLVGMGTTLVAVLIRDGLARWISIGDSPLYLIRNGALRCLNRLHLANRNASGEEGGNHPAGDQGASSALAAAVIGDRLFEVDDPDPIPLQPGDQLIAATDGINSLPERELLRTMANNHGSTAARHAEELIQAVESQGVPRQDNTTVVVIRWSQ